MLSPTYEITTALSHTDELISPPYDIAIVTISYGRVTKSPVWDTMMSKKNMGWPFYAAVEMSTAAKRLFRNGNILVLIWAVSNLWVIYKHLPPRYYNQCSWHNNANEMIWSLISLRWHNLVNSLCILPFLMLCLKELSMSNMFSMPLLVHSFNDMSFTKYKNWLPPKPAN